MRRMLALVAATVFAIVFLAGCASGRTDPDENLRQLAEVEVKEYQGKDLSSILDFRENSIAGPQYIDIETYTLTVDGLVDKPTEYGYAQLLENESFTKNITLHCVEGWSVDILWKGILLEELLDDIGVRDGVVTVIFHSYDGYTTSLPLATVLERDMILAYEINGLVLPPELGFPFQLIAEDKLGYKWAKWITRIELSDDAEYEGYWEQRGYGNEADADS